MSLGLSVELEDQYRRTLDLLQCWIDQPKVLELIDKIKETIALIATSSIESVRIHASQSHNPVVLELVQQQRALKMCDPFRVLTQSEITTSIKTLQNRIQANLYGDGPTWIWGLISLPDGDGKNHLVCSSMKVHAGGSTKPYQLDLLEWNQKKISPRNIVCMYTIDRICMYTYTCIALV